MSLHSEAATFSPGAKIGVIRPEKQPLCEEAATVPSEGGCVGCGAGAHQMCWFKMPLSRAKAGGGFSPFRVTAVCPRLTIRV